MNYSPEYMKYNYTNFDPDIMRDTTRTFLDHRQTHPNFESMLWISFRMNSWFSSIQAQVYRVDTVLGSWKTRFLPTASHSITNKPVPTGIKPTADPPTPTAKAGGDKPKTATKKQRNILLYRR